MTSIPRRRRLRQVAITAASVFTVVGAGLAAIGTADAATAATTYYVATTGSDSGAGTLAAPFATIQKAIDTVAAGGTIAVRGGTYALTANLQITKSGTAAAPITLTRYGTEKVVIDGEALAYTP